jgi:ribosomal protein S12 methylthiotransferase accessory factor
MSLETEHINQRIEFFDAFYGEDRQRQYDVLPRLYNQAIGPVTAVNVHRPKLLDLFMYGTSCRHSPVGRLFSDLVGKSPIWDSAAIPIGGKGPTMRQAFLGNMGEACERILAALHSRTLRDMVEFGTHAQLKTRGLPVLAPEKIPLFSAEQYATDNFEFVPFTENTSVAWLRGQYIFANDPVFVPAQLVAFHWYPFGSEARIGYATSGGLVFHTNFLQAILHGIYENIERDAINLRWYCKLPPPVVEVDLVEFLKLHADQCNPRIATPYLQKARVLLNTLDVPFPVFTVLTIDKSRDERALLAGGGGWGKPERALIQAIFEIGQAQIGYALTPNAWEHITPHSQVSELTDFYYSLIYYGFRENLSLLSWYTNGPAIVTWDEVPSISANDLDQEYTLVKGLLIERNIDPILFDFSDSCWPDAHLIKVFMPQLTHAHIPSHGYFGHPRYYSVPMQMGLQDRILTYGDLNQMPLPFP